MQGAVLMLSLFDTYPTSYPWFDYPDNICKEYDSSQVQGLIWCFVTCSFLWRRVAWLAPTLQARVLSLWIIVQYISSYMPCLQAVSSVHSLRTCHTMVRRAPLNMDQQKCFWVKYLLVILATSVHSLESAIFTWIKCPSFNFSCGELGKKLSRTWVNTVLLTPLPKKLYLKSPYKLRFDVESWL